MERTSADQAYISWAEAVSRVSVSLDASDVDVCLRVSKEWSQIIGESPFFADRAGKLGINERMKGTRTWRAALIYFAVHMHLQPRTVRKMEACGVFSFFRTPDHDYQFSFQDRAYSCDRFCRGGLEQRWALALPENTLGACLFPASNRLFMLAVLTDGNARSATWDGNEQGAEPAWGTEISLFNRAPSRIASTRGACRNGVYAVCGVYENTKTSAYVFGACSESGLEAPTGWVSGDDTHLIRMPSRNGEQRLIFQTFRSAKKPKLTWYNLSGSKVRQSHRDYNTFAAVQVKQAREQLVQPLLPARQHTIAGKEGEVLFSYVELAPEGHGAVALFAWDVMSGEPLAQLILPFGQAGRTRSFHGCAVSGAPAVLFTREDQAFIVPLVNGRLTVATIKTWQPTGLPYFRPHAPQAGIFYAAGKNMFNLIRFSQHRDNGIVVTTLGELPNYNPNFLMRTSVAYGDEAGLDDALYIVGTDGYNYLLTAKEAEEDGEKMAEVSA